MNQKKLISTFAILSTVLMIASSFLLIYSKIIVGNGIANKSYLLNGFMILVYILFAIYVLACFFKEKYKPLGINIAIIFSYSYLISDFFMQTLNMSLIETLSYVFRAIVITIFSISLYKKYDNKMRIVGTVAVLINIFIEIKWMYDFIMFVFSVPTISTMSIIQICIDFIGFILFLLTIYFMSFFQTPLCKKKEKLGVNFMIGIGIILTISGIVSIAYGNSVNNNVSTQMESFFESGKTNTGDNFVIIGFIVAAIGVILLFLGIIKYVQEDRLIKQVHTHADIKKCRKCGLSLEPSAKFCPFCGETVIKTDDSNSNTQILTENKQDNNDSKSTTTKICSSCKAENPIDAKFCNNCGEPTSNLKMCPKCNAEMSKTAKFCNNCGAAFEINENN